MSDRDPRLGAPRSSDIELNVLNDKDVLGASLHKPRLKRARIVISSSEDENVPPRILPKKKNKIKVDFLFVSWILC